MLASVLVVWVSLIFTVHIQRVARNANTSSAEIAFNGCLVYFTELKIIFCQPSPEGIGFSQVLADGRRGITLLKQRGGQPVEL